MRALDDDDVKRAEMPTTNRTRPQVKHSELEFRESSLAAAVRLSAPRQRQGRALLGFTRGF